MGTEGIVPAFDPLELAVRRQHPTLRLVAQVGAQDLLLHLFMHGRVLDRYQGFDPAVEVARHPVGRGDEDLGLR